MIIDSFYDMTKTEIKAVYQKSENTFNVAVNRMLKELNDSSLKYKNDNGEICIKAAGVEWLHNYFQKPTDLSTEPMVIHLQERVKALEEMLINEKQSKEDIKSMLQDAFNAQIGLIQENHEQKLLLTEKTAEIEQKRLENENDELRKEIERLKNRNFFDRVFNNF